MSRLLNIFVIGFCIFNHNVSGDADATAQLQAAMTAFNQTNHGCYEFQYAQTCFCLNCFIQSMDIKVINNEVEQVIFAEGNEFALDNFCGRNNDRFSSVINSSSRTIDDLFELIKDAINRSLPFSVDYHDTIGIPLSLYIDRVPGAINDEIYYDINCIEFIESEKCNANEAEIQQIQNFNKHDNYSCQVVDIPDHCPIHQFECDRFYDGCNTCSCDGENIIGCTRRVCLDRYHGEERCIDCESNTLWNTCEDCNDSPTCDAPCEDCNDCDDCESGRCQCPDALPIWDGSECVVGDDCPNNLPETTIAVETDDYCPEHCVHYFDGCNNCNCENPAKPACTLKFCPSPRSPSCNGCEDDATMEFTTCGGCDKTCDDLNPICTLQCRIKCQCKRDTPIYDPINGICISSDECPLAPAPTPEPTTTPAPTPAPTPEPTPEPTKFPSVNPTIEPTDYPTPQPTLRPTLSPIRDICPYEFRNGESFDYVIVYDNSCKMEDEDCIIFLDGIGEIVSRIKDDNANDSRVAVVEFNNDESSELISFNDLVLQNDVQELIKYIKWNGDCTNGNGFTDILDGISNAADMFNDDTRNKKIITISGCKDNENNINGFCNDPHGKLKILDNETIDLYAVNLLKVSNQTNTISKADEYLLCLADNDPNRVCIGDDSKGVSSEEFDEIIETCLLPQICLPPLQPTWPTREPTPQPTWPSSSPTDNPTKSPSKSPTTKPSKWPTPGPTEDPTSFPTSIPTVDPTSFPTSIPTQYPTKWKHGKSKGKSKSKGKKPNPKHGKSNHDSKHSKSQSVMVKTLDFDNDIINLYIGVIILLVIAIAIFIIKFCCNNQTAYKKIKISVDFSESDDTDIEEQ